MTYQEVLVYLEQLQMHKIKLGLDAMRNFLGKVGNPQENLNFVHLAGTNGKGTVCMALCEILHRSHYRTAVYTSPHLSSIRERFRVGEEQISEADFTRIGSRIIDVLGDEKITYFEFTTALALLWFAESRVDLVMLETGMGGRLDATNVVRPLVSVITSISLDHQAWLGETIAEIAAEKAGIIKGGVPVVSAAGGDAAVVIAQKAEEEGAPLYRLHHEFDYVVEEDNRWRWQGQEGFGTPLAGLVSRSVSLAQQENESLALAVLPLLEAHGFRVAEAQIRSGLASLHWPGRMELLTVTYGGKEVRFLLDGAHNPAGVENLAATLERHFPCRRLALWGSMADKELGGMLHRVGSLFDFLILTRVEGERSAEPEQLFFALLPGDRKRAVCEPDIREALTRVVHLANKDTLVVVAGSLYLVGAIRAILCGEDG